MTRKDGAIDADAARSRSTLWNPLLTTTRRAGTLDSSYQPDPVDDSALTSSRKPTRRGVNGPAAKIYPALSLAIFAKLLAATALGQMGGSGSGRPGPTPSSASAFTDQEVVRLSTECQPAVERYFS